VWKTREVVGEYEVRASNCAVRWETEGPEKYGSYVDKEGQRRNGEASGRRGSNQRLEAGMSRASNMRGQVLEVFEVLEWWTRWNVIGPITHVFP
jgi:hypothetical protein